MSKFVFYLPVKPFIGQWLTYHYGNPVTFPARSAENSAIRKLVTKQPKDKTPMKPEGDYVAVAIPDSQRKKPEYYNYMCGEACKVLNKLIDSTFKMQFWNDINDLSMLGVSILDCVRTWCEQNGISIDYDYTLKMRYQRMRDAHLENGVDLRRKTWGKKA